MGISLILYNILILHQFFNNAIRQTKITIDLLAPVLISQKYLKKLFLLISIHQLEAQLNSKSLVGFHKNHITQHALLKMIGTWDSMLNERNEVRTIVMDFSKAFCTLNHNLLLCKLKAHGFDTNAIT